MITLTPGGGTVTGGNATNNSTNTETINLPVTLAAGNHTLAGATLDLSGSPTAQALNFGAKQFLIAGTGVGGRGVIVNHGVSQFNALQHVTLLADSTIAGGQRFDIRSVPTSALNASLHLAGNTLTKNGTNQFSLVGTDVTDGNIVVNQGTFSIGDGGVVILGSGSYRRLRANGALQPPQCPSRDR